MARALGCDSLLLLAGYEGELHQGEDVEYIDPADLSLESLRALERDPSDNLAIGIASQVENIFDVPMRTDTLVTDGDIGELVTTLLATSRGDKISLVRPIWEGIPGEGRFREFQIYQL